MEKGLDENQGKIGRFSTPASFSVAFRMIVIPTAHD
jgi:hypothetical protein